MRVYDWGCLLWIQSEIYALPLWVQCCMVYHRLDLTSSNTVLHYNRTKLWYLDGEIWHIALCILPGWSHTNINTRLSNWILRVAMMPALLSLVTMQIFLTSGVTSYDSVCIRTTVFSCFSPVMYMLRTHIYMGLSFNHNNNDTTKTRFCIYRVLSCYKE